MWLQRSSHRCQTKKGHIYACMPYVKPTRFEGTFCIVSCISLVYRRTLLPPILLHPVSTIFDDASDSRKKESVHHDSPVRTNTNTEPLDESFDSLSSERPVPGRQQKRSHSQAKFAFLTSFLRQTRFDPKSSILKLTLENA